MRAVAMYDQTVIQDDKCALTKDSRTQHSQHRSDTTHCKPVDCGNNGQRASRNTVPVCQKIFLSGFAPKR